MAIALDHLIVPARDPAAAARGLAELLGVPWERGGHFTPVYVNAGLTLDFERAETFERHHYCFRVGPREFDAILARVKAAGVRYRSQPHGPEDMRINTRGGGRNIYWNDADGHVWEMLTVSYARQERPAPKPRATRRAARPAARRAR